MLQFNAACTNVDSIFRAITFLRDRLPEKAHLRDQDFRFNLSRDSGSFKELAVELGSAEPSLRGVTANSLFSVYERIVQERRNLEAWLKVATDEPWRDTRLAEMALDLVHTEDQIKERESRQKAQKTEERSQELASAEVTSRRTLAAMLGISGDHVEMDNTEDTNILEDNMAEEVASTSNGIAKPVSNSSACHSTTSTVNTVQSTSSAISSNTQITVLPITHSPLDTAQSSGLGHLKRPLNMSGSSREASSASDSTDADLLSPPSLGNPTTTMRHGAKRMRRTALDSDQTVLLAGRVKELEEHNRLLTARIDHLMRLVSTHRTWLEEERLPMLSDRMTSKSTQLIDSQLTQFKNQMDQVTSQMNTHLYQSIAQLNGQGSQLNAQLNAQGSQFTTQMNVQGSQLTQLKTQVSQLNIDMSDIQRELRKWVSSMQNTNWESSPLHTGTQTSFSSKSRFL